MSNPRRPQLEWPWDGIKAIVTLAAAIAVAFVLMQPEEPKASLGPSLSPLALTPSATATVSPVATTEPTTSPPTPVPPTDTPVPPDSAEIRITLPETDATLRTPLRVFTGTGPVGATITLLDDEDVLGTTSVGENGSWRFISRAPLSEGSHTIQAVILDEAGGRQMESALIEITIAP